MQLESALLKSVSYFFDCNYDALEGKECPLKVELPPKLLEGAEL